MVGRGAAPILKARAASALVIPRRVAWTAFRFQFTE
jgi:hypothetical protein